MLCQSSNQDSGQIFKITAGNKDRSIHSPGLRLILLNSVSEQVYKTHFAHSHPELWGDLHPMGRTVRTDENGTAKYFIYFYLRKVQISEVCFLLKFLRLCLPAASTKR